LLGRLTLEETVLAGDDATANFYGRCADMKTATANSDYRPMFACSSKL